MIMKLRDDQVRLQGLLKETITLLCKNGLHFKNGFCVEALIGITTDDSDVFLVNIKESIGSVGADADDGQHDTSKQGDGDHGDDGRSRGSRKRPPDGGTRSTPMKRSRSDDDESDYDSDASDNDDTNVKREPDEDLVFVKQELSDYDPQNTAQFAQPGQAHQSFGTQDASFDGSHDGSTSGSAWNQSTANQSTANMDPNQMALQAQSQSGSQQIGDGLLCQICQDNLPDVQSLNAHYDTAHPIGEKEAPKAAKTYDCEVCEKSYAYYSGLRNHLIVSHNIRKLRKPPANPRKYVCHMCGQGYTTTCYLNLHLQMVHDVIDKDAIAAKVCKDTLPNVPSLNAPYDTAHPIAEKEAPKGAKKYVCEVCEKSYISYHGLRNHLVCSHNIRKRRILANPRKYACDMCGKGYTTKGYLKLHLKMIHGVIDKDDIVTKEPRKFVCDVCDKRYTSKYNLRGHMATVHGTADGGDVTDAPKKRRK